MTENNRSTFANAYSDLYDLKRTLYDLQGQDTNLKNELTAARELNVELQKTIERQKKDMEWHNRKLRELIERDDQVTNVVYDLESTLRSFGRRPLTRTSQVRALLTEIIGRLKHE